MYYIRYKVHYSWVSFVFLAVSDVKRGQNIEAETEVRRGGQGRGRGQFLEVEAKAEAKDKLMNKKYQMIIDNIPMNLYLS